MGILVEPDRRPINLAAAARFGRASRVYRLLEEDAIVDQPDAKGVTALAAAAKEGHAFVAQMLIRHGASVDIAAFEGLTGCRCSNKIVDQLSAPLWHSWAPAAPSVPRSILKPREFHPIDLAPFVWPERYDDEARMRSARLWDHSFRTVGFAKVSGHGVAEDLIADFRTAARMFFNSPDNHKHPEELNGIGQRYCYEVERVMHALHRMSALALGLDIHFFEDFYTKPASVLVISNYPVLNKSPVKVPDGKLRYRAHSDYSGFTILQQDETDFSPGGFGGLEVDIAGTWVPIKPEKGTLVVNIGDLFELWTNDRWRSTPHRVVSPRLKDPAAGKARLTAMLFSGPNLDSTISPIHTCVDKNNPSRYSSMTAAKHMESMWRTKSKEARYKNG